MSRTWYASLALAVTLTTGLAPAQEPALLQAINPNAPALFTWEAAQRERNNTIAGTEFVTLDGKALLDMAPGERRSFELRLFADTYSVEMRYFQSQLKHRIYTGSIAGEGSATIVFGIDPSAIGSAVIELSNRKYELNYTGISDVHGLHLIDDQVQHPHPSCGVGPEHYVAAAPADGSAKPATIEGPSVLQSSVVTDIDVCVFYTPQARNGAGSATAIENTIATRTGTANAGSAATGADINLRLVYTALTQYTETGNMSTDLSRFRSTTDSHMTEVHGLRTQYGGDLMGLIVNTGSACGVGYVMCNVNQSFRSSAFSVTRRSCFGQHSYTHEMGHNMGCTHDRANGGCAAYTYSYGFRTSNNRYRSIMAYSPGSRINKWSGEFVTHTGLALGNAQNDNVRSLNNAKDTIALFKPTMIGVNAPTLTSISPMQVSNYQPLGETITLTGADLGNVSQIDVGNQSPPFNVVNGNTITFQVTGGYDIGANSVVATNNIGVSNALSLTVTPSHPSVLGAPVVHIQGMTENYATYTDVGWEVAYFFSASNVPSSVPGLVTLGIGNAFADLVYFTGAVADAGGKADMSLTTPSGFGGGTTLHWQVITYDPSNLTVPLEVSNVDSVIYL